MIDTCQRNKSDRRMLANAQQMLEDSRKKIDLIQMQLLRAKREAQGLSKHKSTEEGGHERGFWLFGKNFNFCSQNILGEFSKSTKKSKIFENLKNKSKILRLEQLMHHYRVEYAMYGGSKQATVLFKSASKTKRRGRRSRTGPIGTENRTTQKCTRTHEVWIRVFSKSQNFRFLFKNFDFFQISKFSGNIFSKFEFRRYPNGVTKSNTQWGNPPVSRSMLQKPNAIVGNLEVRLVGVQVNNSKNKEVTSTFSRYFTSCIFLVALAL